MVHPQEVPRASRSPQAVRLGVTGFKDTTKTPGGRDTHDSRDRHTRTSKLLKNQPQNQPHPPCTYSRARPHRQPRNARVITNHTTHPIKLSVVVTSDLGGGDGAQTCRRGEQRGREPDRNGDGTPQCTGRRRGTWPQRPRISECVSRLPPVRLFTGVSFYRYRYQYSTRYGQSTVCGRTQNPSTRTHGSHRAATIGGEAESSGPRAAAVGYSFQWCVPLSSARISSFAGCRTRIWGGR